MLIREVLESEKEQYNQVVNHPLQSWEWGEFREKTGVEVIRLGCFEEKKLLSAFQLTIHSIPYTPYTLGYFPKGGLPHKPMIDSLKKIAKEQNCLFIKLEPNVGPHPQTHGFLIENSCRVGKSLFPKHTFQIDLTSSEDELLSAMKEKTRYNVRLAQKYGVAVQEDNSPEAFEAYLRLTQETTRRQHFFAHNEQYHRLMWKTLQPTGLAHLLIATRNNGTMEQSNNVLAAWILFLFNGVLYYPYGASSSYNRQVMASNLMMWEAIKWGKAHGAKAFDLWGALDPNPNPKDPWYGFHRFKEGYGGKLVEFIGTYDLIINPFLYPLYNLADNLRWKFLRLKSYLSF